MTSETFVLMGIFLGINMVWLVLAGSWIVEVVKEESAEILEEIRVLQQLQQPQPSQSPHQQVSGFFDPGKTHYPADGCGITGVWSSKSS